MSELVFQDVTVQYGHGESSMTAVDAVRLIIPSGKTVGLVGESGSGKSTLGKAAVGLTAIASGHITVGGTPIGRRRGARAPIQMVFQDPYASLDPRRTIGQSIADSIPKGSQQGRAARDARVEELLQLVSLDPSRSRSFPDQLSGGQRQRVALARALAGEPEIVIADEITSALDVSVQGAILNLVRDLQSSLGLSMLFISHNVAVVRYVSDFIAVMYLGRIVEYGLTDEVLLNPQHPYTRTLLAAVPDPEVALLARSHDPVLARIADAEPPDPHNPPQGCRFHPRCPMGPLVVEDREICLERDPVLTGPADGHGAACHFADLAVPSALLHS